MAMVDNLAYQEKLYPPKANGETFCRSDSCTLLSVAWWSWDLLTRANRQTAQLWAWSIAGTGSCLNATSVPSDGTHHGSGAWGIGWTQWMHCRCCPLLRCTRMRAKVSRSCWSMVNIMQWKSCFCRNNHLVYSLLSPVLSCPFFYI